MKNFFLSSCIVAASLFLFTNCSKEDSPGNVATTNYSPLTVGSFWVYSYKQNANPAVTDTLTALSKDTSINSKNYKVLGSSANIGNSYLTKIDSNYYRFASYPAIGSFEELYLKDNRDVNSPWTNTVTFNYPGVPIPLTANLTYTIKEKGISYTVAGKSYSDVIHVRLDASIAVAGGNVGGGDFYYAKNIGLISGNILLTVATLNVTFSSTQELTAYQIK